MPDLSIIIISYNTSAITKRCLDTLVASSSFAPEFTAEIIILDNNSPDDSAEMLTTYARQINASSSQLSMKVILKKENHGFGKGNNEAVKHATSDTLLFLNSDTEALEDALPALYKAFTSGTYTFAGAHLLNKDLSEQPSAGRFYTLPIAFLALFLFADRFHITRYAPTQDQLVDWVSGACFITSRASYETLGGFDPAIFMYWEEVDLFYRAHQQGMSVGYVRKPTFIHLEGASSGSRTAPIVKVFEGYIMFYKKHYSPLHVRVITYMLKLKASVSWMIGKLTLNTYLTTTYSHAYEAIKKN